MDSDTKSESETKRVRVAETETWGYEEFEIEAMKAEGFEVTDEDYEVRKVEFSGERLCDEDGNTFENEVEDADIIVGNKVFIMLYPVSGGNPALKRVEAPLTKRGLYLAISAAFREEEKKEGYVSNPVYCYNLNHVLLHETPEFTSVWVSCDT